MPRKQVRSKEMRLMWKTVLERVMRMTGSLGGRYVKGQLREEEGISPSSPDNESKRSCRTSLFDDPQYYRTPNVCKNCIGSSNPHMINRQTPSSAVTRHLVALLTIDRTR